MVLYHSQTQCHVINLRLIIAYWMCIFFCGTISHAKLLLHWSIKHYQVTFERHSGCGKDTLFIDFTWKHYLFVIQFCLTLFLLSDYHILRDMPSKQRSKPILIFWLWQCLFQYLPSPISRNIWALVQENLSSGVCKLQRLRLIIICYSLFGKYSFLASLYSWGDWLSFCQKPESRFVM